MSEGEVGGLTSLGRAVGLEITVAEHGSQASRLFWSALLGPGLLGLVLGAAGILRWRAGRRRSAAQPDAARVMDAELLQLGFAATHTPNAVCLTDRSGRVEWINASFTCLTGLTREVAIGRPLADLFQQTGAPPCGIPRNLEGADPFSFELRIHHHAGHVRWGLIAAQPSLDADGHTTGWVVVCNDLTELKRAQGAIERRAQQTLHYKTALLELVQSDLADQTAALRRITETAARTLGLERVSVWFAASDASAIHCKALYCRTSDSHQQGLVLSAADHPRYFAALSEHNAILAVDAQTDPRTAEFTESYLRPLDIQSMLDVPIWVNGRSIGVLCHEQVGARRAWTDEECAFANAVADVVALTVLTAERQGAEAALVLERDRSRRIIMGAPVIICGVTPDGAVTFINPAGERITGYPAEALIGHGFWGALYGDEPIDELHKILRLIQQGDLCGYEKALTTKSGDRVTVAWDTMTRRDEHGHPIEIIAFGYDVTARAQAEVEHRAAREAAEAALRLKSEFLATVSHEVRTPLNGVVGMTQLLLDTPLTVHQREYAETALRSSEALLAIINEILDFSKIEAGKLTLEAIDFDPRAVMEEAVGLVADLSYGKGVPVTGIVSGEVPAVLRGDPGRLRQVLVNLLSNAVKFTNHGEVVARASVAERTADAVLVRFEVTDTGIGLTGEQQSRIFRPFTQADGSTTRRYGGTGLGLAISKRLVELLEGSIGVTSAPGAGSTFWFTARLAFGSPEPAVVANPALSGARVLIVDREGTTRSAIAQMTAWLGAAPDTADAGDQAIRMVHDASQGGHPYRAILASTVLIDMEGVALAHRISQETTAAAPPVVLVTPPSRTHDAHPDAAVHAMIVTPVRHSVLRRTLLSALGGSQPDAVVLHAVLPTPGPARVEGRRVLVAEDNVINQKVAVKLLEKLGYQVDVVANGREAVDAVVSIPYAVVLMDCQMPEIDGFDATRLIREDERAAQASVDDPGAPRHIPIVAMTANAQRGDRERCLAAGMDDYLSKPISKESLQAVLDRWI